MMELKASGATGCGVYGFANALNLLMNASFVQLPIPVVGLGVIFAERTIPFGILNSLPPWKARAGITYPLSTWVWHSMQAHALTR